MSDAVKLLLTLSAATSALLLFGLYRWSLPRGEPYKTLSIIVAVTLGIEFSIRPLALVASNTLGWDPSTFRPTTRADSDSLVFSSLLCAACVGLFVFSIRLGAIISDRVGARVSVVKPPDARPWFVPNSVVLWSGVAITVALGLTYGNFNSVASGNFGRQDFGSGYLYALVNLAAVGGLLALKRADDEALKRPGVRLAILASFVIGTGVQLLILGGRAEVLAIGIAALVVVRSRYQRPTDRVLILSIVFIVFASSLYRVTTREVYYTENATQTRPELVVSALRDPLSLVTRGDVSSFDKVVTIDRRDLDVRAGSTYEAAILGRIPSQALRREAEGGNRTFTRLYLPERYALSTTYEGVSLAGEGLINFGPLGAILAFAFVGVFLGGLAARSARRGVGLSLGIFLGLFPSIVRADAYNTVALASALVLVTLVATLMRAVVAARVAPSQTTHRQERASLPSGIHGDQ